MLGKHEELKRSGKGGAHREGKTRCNTQGCPGQRARRILYTALKKVLDS